MVASFLTANIASGDLAAGNEVDIIYLDYSKAFDKMDHHILLVKLKHYGITCKLYTWVEFFLSNRLQAVILERSRRSKK